MKKKVLNCGMAVLVLILVEVLFLVSQNLLVSGAYFIGTLFLGPDGIRTVYECLTDNANLLSCMIYLLVGTVFVLWYYFAFVMKQGTSGWLTAQTKRLTPVGFGLTFILIFALEHAVTILMTVIALLAPQTMQEYGQMMESSGANNYSIVWFIATVVLPPVVEETIFRGIIFQYLRRAGMCFVAANLIQAVFFGIYHMNLIQGIYAAFLGFIFGYLVWRYDSILITVFAHALFNLLGTLFVDIEYAVLPPFLINLIIVFSIPVTAAVIALIHLRVDEKGRGEYGMHEENGSDGEKRMDRETAEYGDEGGHIE